MYEWYIRCEGVTGRGVYVKASKMSTAILRGKAKIQKTVGRFAHTGAVVEVLRGARIEGKAK